MTELEKSQEWFEAERQARVAGLAFKHSVESGAQNAEQMLSEFVRLHSAALEKLRSVVDSP